MAMTLTDNDLEAIRKIIEEVMTENMNKTVVMLEAVVEKALGNLKR